MKVLILKLGEKTYTTGKITAYLSRQALKIQKESLELAEKGLAIQKISEMNEDNSIEQAKELLVQMDDLKTSKSNLICEVYQNKFNIDDLEKELSNEEIDNEVNKILQGITGIIEKN